MPGMVQTPTIENQREQRKTPTKHATKAERSSAPTPAATVGEAIQTAHKRITVTAHTYKRETHGARGCSVRAYVCVCDLWSRKLGGLGQHTSPRTSVGMKLNACRKKKGFKHETSTQRPFGSTCIASLSVSFMINCPGEGTGTQPEPDGRFLWPLQRFVPCNFSKDCHRSSMQGPGNGRTPNAPDYSAQCPPTRTPVSQSLLRPHVQLYHVLTGRP